MDQELKQRLIGAAVITALAAIFVPMLFDDPIDETGKNINELKIPEMPAKVQDVEIMPLPEKAEDVVTEAPIEKPAQPQTASAVAAAPTPAAPAVSEGEDEAALEAPKPKVRLGAKETAPAPHAAKVVEPDAEAEAEDIAPRPEAATASKPAGVPAAIAPAKPAPVVTNKPAVAAEAPAIKPAASAAGESANTRWYLNAGSFSQKANAVALQDSLKQQGFAATLKEVASDKGTVYKVRVGPMLDKAKAQAVKAKLAQINVNSFVSGEE